MTWKMGWFKQKVPLALTPLDVSSAVTVPELNSQIMAYDVTDVVFLY